MGQRDSEGASCWLSAAGCRLPASRWPGFFSGLVDWPGAISPATEILRLRLRMTRRMGRQSRYAVFEIIAEGDTITL